MTRKWRNAAQKLPRSLRLLRNISASHSAVFVLLAESHKLRLKLRKRKIQVKKLTEKVKKMLKMIKEKWDEEADSKSKILKVDKIVIKTVDDLNAVVKLARSSHAGLQIPLTIHTRVKQNAREWLTEQAQKEGLEVEEPR